MTASSAEAERSILHVDMDAFYASVEALEHPELRGKPLIVGGDGARGVVASCSYEARFYGVRSAMPSSRAKRLCPRAIFVAGHFDRYEHYSRRMHAVFHTYTPLVEGISLDEAFLDVTGAQRLFGSAESIGHEIRKRLKDELGLSASVGVASTKHVAKLASEAAKPKVPRAGPIPGAGVFVVQSSKALEFLHPLPVRALWGVGPVSAANLERIGISTVGQIARMPVEILAGTIGEASARHLHDLAWNRDERDVITDHAAKSVGHEQTFPRDLKTREQVHAQFVRLADAVSKRLRHGDLAGRTITAKVRFGSFQTVTRARTVPKATAHAGTLLSVADEVTQSLDVEQGVRLLGLSVSKLEASIPVEQLSLDEDTSVEEIDETRLDDAVDRIRERYGDSAVVPAPLIGPKGPGVMRRGERQWGPGQDD